MHTVLFTFIMAYYTVDEDEIDKHNLKWGDWQYFLLTAAHSISKKWIFYTLTHTHNAFFGHSIL